MFNITNSFEHPSRSHFTVFKFYEKQRSDYFKELLTQKNISFEHDIHEEDNKTFYLFGVRNPDVDQVNKLNYLVNGKYRKPLIPNTYLRWIVLGFSLIMVALAILGALKT